MERYKINLCIWPYSGVKREPASYQSEYERAMRGVETPSIIVKADGFHEALKIAHAIRLGAQLDERIWRVQIIGILQVDDTTRETELMTECAHQ